MHRNTRLLAFMVSALLLVVVATAGVAAQQAVASFDPDQGQLPEGVAVAADGTVYASLATLGQLVRVEDGSSEPVWSVPGFSDGDLGPLGLATAADGTLYAAVRSADPAANGVWHVDPSSGRAARVEGTQPIAFANDIAIDEGGTLYVTDTIAGAVWAVPPGAAAERWIEDPLLAGTGEAGFGFPLGANGIDVHAGTVYVAVTERAHVVAVPIEDDGRAGAAVVFTTLPEAVDGIAIDATGGLVSAHPMANVVTWRHADGELEVIAREADGLDRPASVALAAGPDGAPAAYVANFSVAMGTPLGHGPSIMALELGSGHEAGSTAASGTPSVTATAGDLWFEPSQITLESGVTTSIVLVNDGRVAHNFIVDELGLAVAAAPGSSGTVELVDPPPGEYVFYCSIFGHRQAGMAGKLIVE